MARDPLSSQPPNVSMLPNTASACAVLPKAEAVPSRIGLLSFTGARLVLVSALMAAPWAFGAVQAWAWGSLAVAAVLLLFLWVVESAQQRVLRIEWSPLYIPALLLFILAVVQFCGHFTLDPYATREVLLKFATDFLFFFIAGQLVVTGSNKTWRYFGLGVTVFAFLLSVFAIVQLFSGPGLVYWSVKTEGWAFGPYINHNHYAGLLEMLIPISVAYVFSRPRHHPGRALLAFTVSVTIASQLLSASRGGMISLLAEFAIVAAIIGSRGLTPDWRKLGVVGPVGILTGLLLFFWLDPGGISSRLATIVRLNRATDVGLIQREAVAGDSLRILRDHPWIGTGLGSFGTVYAQYQSFPSDFSWDHAHNDYAEALVESGLVGGILILSALTLWIRLAFRDAANRIKSEADQIRLGAALGCCGFLVHSFFDFNLHVPANAAWFVVCAALASSRTRAATLFESSSKRY